MPNPTEVLQMKFNPNVIERRSIDPGSLEQDDFVINDIPLRIAPDSINIQKESFNNKWNTLRTAHARKIKSGYGTVRLSFTVIFKVSNLSDADNLSRIVAGLRATPFCVVYNKYLDQMLGRPDDEGPVVADEAPRSRSFQPIMLAMSSMTFSTLGHQGQPDCVEAAFDCLWFNYLPFTKYVAFKSGNQYDRPGFPWESPVWQAFYEPFYYSQIPIKFPHHTLDENRTTTLMWREFLLIPKGTPAILEASKSLAEAIQNKPKEIMGELQKIITTSLNVSGYEMDNLRNPDQITSGTLDTLFRNAVKNGYIQPSDEVRKQLASFPQGAITEIAGPSLIPILRKMYGQTKISARLKNDSEVAVAIFDERLTKLQAVAKRGDVIFNTLGGTKYQELLNTDAKYKKNPKYSAGGFQLFGRKQTYKIIHQAPDGELTPGAIIQQIVVSFRNILAVVPMLAYRYPTIQHVGSIEADVNFVINARNTAAQDIRNIYDRIETMAVKYRQIPAEFTNLDIRNDFLSLFGLREFVTQSMQISSIPDQPGRSMVTLSLEDAGITSKDKNTEELEQEFIGGNFEMFGKIWQVIFDNMELVENTQPRHSTPYQKYINFVHGQTNERQPTEADYYFCYATNIPLANNSAYIATVDRAVSIYNEYVASIHRAVFDRQGVDGDKTFSAIMSLQSNDPEFGYLPGIADIKESLVARNNAYRKNNQHNKIRHNVEQNTKDTTKFQKAADLASKITGIEDISSKDQHQTLNERMRRIYDVGTNRYATQMRAVFDTVIRSQINLPQFQHLAKLKEQMGLTKGLLAYPDFREQLSGVAKLVEGVDTKADGPLMKYEPDCYFYYPLHHGGNSSPLSGLVDASYRTIAKTHSQNIFSTAQDSISEFYENTYLSRLKIGSNQGPWQAVTKDYGGSKMYSGFYNNLTITNSTQTETLCKSVVPDPNAKIHTNWYDQKNPSIKSPNTCQHSTNLTELWEGIGTATGQQTLPGATPITPSTPPTPSPSTSTGLSKNATVTANGIPVPAGVYSGPVTLISSPALQGKNTYTHLDKMRVEVQPIFEKLLDKMAAANMPAVISNSYRTYLEQVQKEIDGYGVPSSTLKAQQAIKEGRFPAGTSMQKIRRKLIEDGTIKVGIGGHHSWGLAADIIPKGWNWRTVSKKEIDFFKLLRTFCKELNMVNGGAWFKKGFGAIWAPHGIGYDPAHCQINEFDGRGIPQDWQRDIMAERKGQKQSVQRFVPAGPVQKRLEQIKSRPVARDVTSTISSPLGLAINAFEQELYKGQSQGLMRAYPTFKLYFIEDDSGERKRLQFDDFFSYQAVQSIRIIRSRKIAADVCEIYLTNISGMLSNRKYPNRISPNASEAQSGMKADTKSENPITSLLLQEGMHIHVKLGYSNDPQLLEGVFSGMITEVEFSESDELVRILAQSYAIEMLQDIKGLEKPKTKTSREVFGWDFWGFGSEATTGRILEEMMAEPELLHFGRWSPKNDTSNPARTLLTQRWTYEPQPQDDNIFAPSNAQDLGALAGGIFFKKLQYIIYSTTIWDICQEMTLRHPNFIASVVPYSGTQGERMTLFFGLPNQLYFARDPDFSERSVDDQLVQAQKDVMSRYDDAVTTHVKSVPVIGSTVKALTSMGRFLGNVPEPLADLAAKRMIGYSMRTVPKIQEKIENAARSTVKTIATSIGYTVAPATTYALSNMKPRDVLPPVTKQTVENLVGEAFKAKRLDVARQAGYIKPFRQYHLITSSQHIIANNIKASSRDVANTIAIKYASNIKVVEKKEKDMGPDASNVAITGDEEVFTLKLDNAMPEGSMRTQMGQFINVTNDTLAKRYALGLLCRNLKDIYKGEIVTIGLPSCKPYDIIYLFDEYTDMLGAFEVEEVQHIFDQENGFRTEIKPDMLVQTSEFSILGSAEALGVIMEGQIRSSNNGAMKHFAPFAYSLGNGFNALGGFMAQKIINYTQLATPVIMTPLLYHGRAFSGGLSTQKMPFSFWSTVLGGWESQEDNTSIDKGYADWVEDTYDDVLSWRKNKMGGNSQGSFWDNDGDTGE